MRFVKVEEGSGQGHEDESLLDLVANYGREAEQQGDAAGVRDEKKKSGKGKGGEK